MWYLSNIDISLDNAAAYLDGFHAPPVPPVPFWARLWTTLFLGFTSLRATRMNANTLYIGDTKKLFFATGIDLSASPLIRIKCTAPSGVKKEFAATAVADTDPDGNAAWGVVYTTLAADLDEAGEWQAQVWDDVSGYSSPAKFYVLTP